MQADKILKTVRLTEKSNAQSAEFGQYTDPDGNTHVLPDTLGFQPANGLTLSLAISIGSIAAGIQRLRNPEGVTP